MNTCHSPVFRQMLDGVELRRMWLPDPGQAFETQRRRLANAGLARIDAFDHLAGRLPRIIGPILLVPVTPRQVDWVGMMGLIELDDKKGFSSFKPEQYKNLEDKIAFPQVPTMLTGGDYGVDCRNVSGVNAFERI